eukprot:1145109-Pelagomonas_calceolata.AAC.2
MQLAYQAFQESYATGLSDLSGNLCNPAHLGHVILRTPLSALCISCNEWRVPCFNNTQYGKYVLLLVNHMFNTKRNASKTHRRLHQVMHSRTTVHHLLHKALTISSMRQSSSTLCFSSSIHLSGMAMLSLCKQQLKSTTTANPVHAMPYHIRPVRAKGEIHIKLDKCSLRLQLGQ